MNEGHHLVYGSNLPGRVFFLLKIQKNVLKMQNFDRFLVTPMFQRLLFCFETGYTPGQV